MASTLSRRIRRIGILPTTFTVTTEKRLVYDEFGDEVEKEFKIKRPVRHRDDLDVTTRAALEVDIRKAHKLRHKEFRAKGKAAHKAAKDRIKSLRTAGKAKK